MEKLKNSKLKSMLIVGSCIIFLASLESLINAKSVEAFQTYTVLIPNASFNDFIAHTLHSYLSIIFEPIIIILYTLFTINKIKINNYYRLVFGGILIIRLVFVVMEFNYRSVFYYMIVILYLLYIKIVITMKN